MEQKLNSRLGERDDMRGLPEIEQHRQERDDILAAFASTVPLPDARTLREWLRRYPEHAHDLVDLAVSLIEDAQQLPETVSIEIEDDLGASDEGELVVGAMPIVRALLSQSETSEAWQHDPLNTGGTPAATVSRPEVAGDKPDKLTIQEVAEVAMLSTNMVSRLLRHEVHYPSIPEEAIERLAQAMRMRPDTLKDYLSHRRISQPRRSNPDRTPQQSIPIQMIGLPTDMHMLVPEAFLVDFHDAIDADQSMSSDQRDIWLALSE